MLGPDPAGSTSVSGDLLPGLAESVGYTRGVQAALAQGA